MRTILTIALFSLAFNVSAACSTKRPGELPVVPDGDLATAEQMQRAQAQAQEFMEQVGAYMDCRVMNRRQHKALAERVEQLSENYNDEVMKYRLRSPRVASN